MFYGGDYNPEQWPEEVWLDDARRMVEARVNLATVGVFAWSRIQPAEGVFEFDWLDRVIGILSEHGIGVDLATATASPPPWLSAHYPDSVAVDATGARYWPGSRQHQAPTSPDYRRLAGELVTRLAERYAQHPAVVMWHVNNEYGCHLSLDYSDAAAAAFRRWLEARYGSVEALNDAWGTSFWSQRYGDFAEVFPPRHAPYSHNPTQLLDFARFSSDALLECYLMERERIREAGALQPITTNFMGLHRSTDYWRWAPELDVISDDSYPDPADQESFRRAALQRDLMRSLKPGSPWLLMEQASNAVNWRPSNAVKAPGQMAALSAQAVGRGADGILFFQWRQSRAGSEKFHSAMLPHTGTETRTWGEVVEFGQWLDRLPDLPPPGHDAEVAILVSWDSWWAVENPDHPVVLDYADQIWTWYEAFSRHHIQVDFRPPDGELDGYRLVIAPQLYLLTDSAAANLSGYVEAGGSLLVGAFSDVVDERDQFRDGGYLTQLGPLLGVRVEEFHPLALDEDGPGERWAPFKLAGEPLRGRLLAEEIQLAGATPVATFRKGRLSGCPSLTSAAYGQGVGYYLATLPDADSALSLTAWLADAAGVRPVLAGLPERVEAARRGPLLTLINHDDRPDTVRVRGRDILTGATVVDPTLEPQGYLLLTDAQQPEL
jgi:beta-galactosidase